MAQTPSPSQREERLERILADYLHAVEAGSPPDRALLLKQHPDLAADLGSFFRNRDAMERIAGPIKQQLPGAETMGESPPSNGGVGMTIRYFGDYELLEEIARGGMGVVYKARQVSLNRVVALKMILAGQLASPADVARFRAEAEAAGHLDHPNIVPIYEVGEHEGQHYFSMKLVEGGSLASLSREPAASAEQQRASARVLATVARAVHHAHQRGILHRDLKPGNILIDAQGQPHVTDFGLARRVEGDSRLTQSGAIVGTPSYMAPEQARSEKVLTTAVDVYSLGAILYELLAGCPPFRAATPLDTVLQVLEEEPVPPRAIRPRIDRDLETICLKCLDKDPDRRYESAAALADELERWQAGEPILARRTGAWERTRKWIKRRPAAAALVAVSSLAVLTLVVVGLVYNAELQEALDDARKARADAEERESTVRRQELTVRRHLYRYDMKAVQDAWENGNGARVLSLLNDHRPRAEQEDLRSFEWYHYWALCHDDVFTVGTSGCQAVAYSPDGRILATAGRDSGSVRVRLWDAATGNELQYDRTTIPNTSSIGGLTFSLDGKTLAAGAGKSVVQWDLPTLKERATITTKDWVHAIRFAGDDANRMIVAEGDGRKVEVNAWDLARHTSQSLFKKTEGSSDTAVFSADGKTVAVSISGSQGATITVSDTSTGRSRLKHETGGLYSFALSPDGKSLAVYRFGSTDVILLLDTATGREQAALVVSVHKVASGVTYTSWPVTNITFSRDGRTLAANVNATIRVWDLVARKEKATYKGSARAITALALSPDGRRLAVVQDQGEVSVRDLTRQQGPETLLEDGNSFDADSLAFSPDNKDLTIHITRHGYGKRQLPKGFDGELRFDAQKVRGRHHTVNVLTSRGALDTYDLDWNSLNLRRVAYAPDGKVVAVADNRDAKSVHLWDAATGRVLRTLTRGTPCYAVAFAPDGRTLAVVCLDRTVVLMDTTAWTERAVLRGHRHWIDAVAFSPDSRAVVTGDYDGTVLMWDVTSGRELRALPRHPHQLSALRFAPDGRRLVTAWQESLDHAIVKMWDPSTGKELGTVEAGWLEPDNVAFSADGKLLTFPARQHGIRLCDGATGEVLHTFPGHGGHVSYLAFAPDGKTLASGSWDGNVKVWDMAGRKLLKTLPGPGWVECMAYTPDGRTLIAAGRDKTLRLWDTATYKERSVLRGAARFAVNWLSLSPDGRTLATSEMNGGPIKLWDVPTGKGRGEILVAHGSMNVPLFAPDGQTLVTDCYGTVQLWNASDGTPRSTLAERLNQTPRMEQWAIAPDGRTLLQTVEQAGNRNSTSAKLWDTAAGRERASFTGLSAAITAKAFTPDSLVLATGHADGSVSLWDLPSGKLRRALPGLVGGTVSCLAFSADGKLLAAAGHDNAIRLCDPATGAVLGMLQGQQLARHANAHAVGEWRPVVGLAFAPTGPLLAAVEMDGVQLWDRTTGQKGVRLRLEPSQQNFQLRPVAFAPDGRTLATCQGDMLKLWDTATGLERLTLWESPELIQALAFSPDGKTLAAATNLRLRLWYAATESEVVAQDR